MTRCRPWNCLGLRRPARIEIEILDTRLGQPDFTVDLDRSQRFEDAATMWGGAQCLRR